MYDTIQIWDVAEYQMTHLFTKECLSCPVVFSSITVCATTSVADPGSGALLTPGSEMGKIRLRDEHPVSYSRDREFRNNFLGLFFYVDPDPGSGIFFTLDPGSGKNIPDTQHL